MGPLTQVFDAVAVVFLVKLVFLSSAGLVSSKGQDILWLSTELYGLVPHS